MAGALYIWIMAAFFVTACAIAGLFISLLWLGHWLEKKETGSKHGFLELPDELRRPAADAEDKTPPAT